MKLHYLQHAAPEDLGLIAVWAAANGVDISCTRLYGGEPLPANAEAYDWLFVMGGPMGVYDESEYPFLKEEKRFIRRAIDAGKVVAGFCLGAQLLAEILGGAVSRNPEKEIGWFKLTMTDSALQNPLFSHFPKEQFVFEWHGDTFHLLPPAAENIASTAACARQGFVYGGRVFAFQFHLENTPAMVEQYARAAARERGAYVQSGAEILAHPEYIRANADVLYRFLDKLKKRFN
jgi:GMP synthase-like glutamine amidotransferase